MGEILTKHRGAFSELIACTWLLERGYEVFRNISQHGIADLVVFRDGKILKIDVKTATREGSRPSLNAAQAKENVAALYVFPDGTCEIEYSPRIKGNETAKCIICANIFTKKKFVQVCCSNTCRAKYNNHRVKYHKVRSKTLPLVMVAS